MRYAAALVPLLVSFILLFAAKQIAQPPSELRPKIFIIGLSKTGTTSIGDALALLGYKRLGWKDIRSRHLVHTWANGDVDALIDQTHYYDAFEDLPWPFMYRQMAEMYPDAKFVLSLRKDEQTWLRSMRRHVSRGEWLPYEYFYGATEVDGHEDVVLHSYLNHTENVRAYFQHQPHRYTELNIDDGDMNWNVLCRFAECPAGRVPSIPFPKSNTAAHWKNGPIIDSLHFLWAWSITRIEELTSSSYYQGGWSSINAVLLVIWKVISVIEQACSELYFKATMALAKPLEFV
ncbi:hypothetical protein BAUCODRAFT_198853 [Baudoinia panamericana UAMH 10762]|uniref:P-loop containing nucleoside triphosphate hydrolase protein n=1 Tax=Baudoinia panamericana (strain UAMH 10762) TaxID=717646 RepID=M2MVZ1_BAUPA|nr:uncharacterized protein BAUCODRAFT_198853 [Baudoinia panamericana UAMH 10762]EMD01152.1 hypothetical protein BAUCODRAFT_198853 [Baudoinia panamericana UAMH 10762]